MKIFISHSTPDKWVARRISEDLVALGAETFLDEKDIETGEPIDDAIQRHLRDSDELVMLVSPTALESAWVLIEIGGAKALGLRLIPILLHVGPNDLPGPLPKHLARDLNSIDAYYSEVRARLAGEAVPQRERERPDRVRADPWKAAIGDRVKVTAPPSDETRAHVLGWNGEMDQYRGVTTTIEELTEVAGGAARLAADHGEWLWALDWLSPVLAAD